jgi:hypothetical protein
MTCSVAAAARDQLNFASSGSPDISRSLLVSSSYSSDLGLIGIRDRLQDFRRTLQIDSAPGWGTALTGTVPLMRQKDHRPKPPC